MKPLFLFAVALLGCGPVCAEPVSLKNLAEGKRVPGSISPDEAYVLLEVFHFDTTRTSVVLARADRSAFLARVPILTEYSTDRPYAGRTTILWNEASSAVAVHDSTARHSKLRMLPVSPQGASVVEIDLLERGLEDLGLEKSGVRSSGQLPLEWLDATTLSMQLRVTLENGGTRSRSYRVRIAEDRFILVED